MKKGRTRALGAAAAAVTLAGGLGSFPLSASGAGAVVINEVCTKNTTAAAPDGQFYDYIELYNPGSTAVSVAGWRISDDPENPTAYQLPAGSSVPAKGFLTVWCDVAEGSSVAGTSFGLAKKGEIVCLFDANGSLLEKLEIPALSDDTAFGRVPDGSETFAVINKLSAGTSNPTNATDQIVVEPPQFVQDLVAARRIRSSLSAAASTIPHRASR